MATIVVNTYTNEPIALHSQHYEVARCPKCSAGMGNIRPLYLSEKSARERFGLEHEVLRIECQHCGYGICLMPCADAKKKEG